MIFNKLALTTVFILTTVLFASQSALAVESADLPKKKRTKLELYMTPVQAFDYVTKNEDKSLFLDVRTRTEVNFLGMPTNADANVPYMVMNEWYAWDAKKNSFKMEVNSDFADKVAERLEAKGLGKNDPVILTCRSGSRSAKAADLLAGLGYTNVYTIVSGFEGDKVKEGPLKGQRAKNGWKNAGLPWTYKLQFAKMYNVGG